jgi:ankyrin repeat protein
LRHKITANTPLITALLAANLGQEVVVVLELLLEAGANVNAMNYRNETPLSLAIAEHLNPDIVMEFLEYSPNLEVRASNAFTPLMFAVNERIPWIVRELVKRGADLESRDSHGSTSVLLTIKHPITGSLVEILRILCEGGADVNVKSAQGASVLHYIARYTGNFEMIRLVVEAGADLKAVHEGETPLDAFLSNYQTRGGENLDEIIQLLGG